MEIPDTLAYKIRQFRNSGRVVKYDHDLFAAPNWIAVFMGQGILPQRHDPLVDQRDLAQMHAHLKHIRSVIRESAEAAPRHDAYLLQNARAVAP
jgi:tryptophan halogenase